MVGVEESETLEERDRARLFPGLRGMLALTLGNEAIGIDDGGSPLSLPDMAAEPERLTKGQPALAGEAVFNDGAPQNQHVNSRVAALRRSIARHGERRLDRRRPPWLHPWDAAGLQFGDDLVGDFGVKARPILTGARVRFLAEHRGSPRRAPEASLPTSQPVTTNPVCPLTLNLDDGRTAPEKKLKAR